MRKGLRIAVCLLIVLALPLTVILTAFILPAQYDETYLAGLGLKWDRLRSAESPRIVLAGGSGAAFDLNSALLEQELPAYEVVNFGLYAGLGTTVMLDLCLPELREGDVLIFEVEMNAQTLSDYFGAEAMWQAADGRPELLSALPLRDYGGALLGALPAFSAAKARFLRNGNAPAGDGVYARRSFNRYGDLDAPGRERNVMPGGFDANMPLRFDPALVSDSFTEKVNAVASVCERKGVRFYFRLCPMNAAAIPAGEETRIAAFEDALREKLDCPILGGVSDAVMDPGWFFDTNFHLNASGAVAATALLARDFKAALGDPSPVEIALPVMPVPAEIELLDGDNAYEDRFLYEEMDGGLRITALSEAGETCETLTVPVSHDGQPVLSFDAAVFSGNRTLRELTVQENIRSIADGSFEGCTSLERLVLLQPKPADCSVGSALLSGTKAHILVPAVSYAAYCTDYFWARYADRIDPDGAAPEEKAAETEPPKPGVNEVLYLSNGGQLRRGEGEAVVRAMDSAHMRFNTLQGASYFVRSGYVLLGWNTAPDGSGERIGLGSRTGKRERLSLYAQWAEASPEESFIYELRDGEAQLQSWLGGDGVCVIPETLGGAPLRRICADAFSGLALDELVLPSSLRCIEDGAFTDCTILDLTLFDSLRELSEASFTGCAGPRTLHVNAAVSPVYSGSYYDTFSDKYDWLLSIRDRRKIVLASGSSGRYGYDSPMLRRAFPDYEIANMGVYAWSNMRPQLELIRGLMQPGDILLSAPEFDAIEAQFCATNRLDTHFWAMMESNYDAVAVLDLRNYTDIWASFAAYQRIRGGMPGKSTSLSPANYDDDGNYYAFSTYNQYGDFILPRENAERDERHRQNTADYTVGSFPAETIGSLNAVYQTFLDEGISVYFSYTPRNRSSLTEASTAEARAALHGYLCSSLRVPVISDMEDYLLSGVYFWQIDSHTSTEGAAIRTECLIKDLKAAMSAEPSLS